jgi:dTDP-4-amino-4,6-dideoxygalactose transaminase
MRPNLGMMRHIISTGIDTTTAWVCCAELGRWVLDSHVEKRELHDFLLIYFRTMMVFRYFTVPNADYFANYWLSAIVVDPLVKWVNAWDVALALEAENIESRPLWKPNAFTAYFQQYSYYGTTIAETLWNGLCLPSGSNLDDEARARIRNVIVKLIGT